MVAAALAMMLVVAASEEISMTADQALKNLMDGNARFVSGQAIRPNQGSDRLAEVVGGQHPFAVLVGCSDSRIPPEIIFDQGIGDIFVIRTAGQVIDDVALGSIEYAVEHLGVKLVMVLGHDSCGAVKATVDGGEAPGHIGSLVKSISPAVEAARSDGNLSVLDQAIDINVRNIVEQIKGSGPILSHEVADGKIGVVGARYNLSSGAVHLVD
ncbi:MAG TPA: carbonic anhydrase [Methanotrichaceae archaeon]|nr:carbonic anhydrase [Methanotrichaceae archaeon]HQF16864.1 carbonic anhydrase [Methanotrichaceae archaeon]HQI91430.1 carbonic anhydrase [Methanotrichaceae archaeon]HQJ28791.1 carbonic anhydrase [Methanotrichaceae archaeon]